MELSLLMVLVAVLAQVKPASSCGQSSTLMSMNRDFGHIAGRMEVKNCSIIPWQVRVKVSLKGFGSYSCGGSLISKRHVLTAAHCFNYVRHNYQVEVYLAGVNEWVDEESELLSTIKNFTKHHDFNARDQESDIAVLTLEEPVDLNNPCIELICMDPDFQFDGHACIMSGWGDIFRDGTGLLRMVQVDTYDGPKCDRVFNISQEDVGKFVPYPQKMICADVKKGCNEGCQDFSGDPLVCWDKTRESFVQVGVSAYGKACHLADYPWVYTRVPNFQNWINKVMSENNS